MAPLAACGDDSTGERTEVGDEVGEGESGESATESADEAASQDGSGGATTGDGDGDGDLVTTTSNGDTTTATTSGGDTSNGGTNTGDGMTTSDSGMTTNDSGMTTSDSGMTTSDSGGGESCGDGMVSANEACDDGNGVDDDACSNTCTSNLDAQCNEPYQILDLEDRNATFNDGDGKVEWCDRLNGGGHDPQWVGDGWYRFMGGAGTRMPDAPPVAQSCGGEAPGWLLTEHPVILDGVAQRTACFSWSNDSCQWETGIEVVDCDDFYLYHLVNTTTCALRYCGTD